MEIIDGKDLVNMKFVKTEDGYLKEYKPKKERYIPKLNEEYWFINQCGGVECYNNENIEADNYVISHQIVFETEEECEDYKWFLDELDKYKANLPIEVWNDTDIDKYYLYYSLDGEKIETAHSNYDKYDCLYFCSLESAKKFIDEVGEYRIKKYIFDIWE